MRIFLISLIAGIPIIWFVYYLIHKGSKEEKTREGKWREMYPINGGDDPEDAIILDRASKWQRKAKSN